MTHGFVGICSVLVCAALAHATPLDVCCEHPPAFVPAQLAHERVSPPEVRVHSVTLLLLREQRAPWLLPSVLDVAASLIDIARTNAGMRARERALAVELTLSDSYGAYHVSAALTR